MTYKEFIQNILDTRGRFSCGEEYHERHHILPKCMGGTNDEENLIDLYAKEHYEAHRLLAEENSENAGLLYARFMMSRGGGSSKKRTIQNSEEYAEARKKYAQYLSEHNQGENNPNYGNSCLTGTNNPMFGVDRKGENAPWFGKKREPYIGEKWAAGHSKRIFQKDDEGNIINVFNSAAEASRVTGICYTCIKDVARNVGRSIRAGGYKWEYDSNYIPTDVNGKKKVAQIDGNGDLIAVYDSIAEAGNKTGIDKNSISHACSGIQGRKTAGGYKWKILKEENE